MLLHNRKEQWAGEGERRTLWVVLSNKIWPQNSGSILADAGDARIQFNAAI